MRRFNLVRTRDISGVSGIGVVAEGIKFSDGTVAMRWFGTRASTNLYASMYDLLAVHDHHTTEHSGHSTIQWVDPIDNQEEMVL